MATYILLMGVQGAGKGTQAQILKEKLDLPHVTTGGLFRAMKEQDTPLARHIQAIMNAGNLIPDEITIQVVRERLQQPDALRGALFDGFPRTRPQAEALDALLAELGGKITLVASFELDRETAIKRLSSRWQCSKNDQHIYNMLENPPKVAGVCDIDGAPLFQRADDTPEAAAKRIDLYYTQTAPLLEYYEPRGLVKKIDAAQSIDAVTEELMAVVEAATQAD